MKFIATILSAAALLCLAEAEVFDVDWIYGMEDADTAICVPPGSQINFVWETNHNVVQLLCSAWPRLRCLMLTGFMGWRMLILPSVFHQVPRSTLCGKPIITWC